jgi:hypothetical protein
MQIQKLVFEKVARCCTIVAQYNIKVAPYSTKVGIEKNIIETYSCGRVRLCRRECATPRTHMCDCIDESVQLCGLACATMETRICNSAAAGVRQYRRDCATCRQECATPRPRVRLCRRKYATPRPRVCDYVDGSVELCDHA